MKYEKIAHFLKETLKLDLTEKDGYFVMPTACHNEDCKSASHKLYLYKNENDDTPIFTCYTQCGDSFNVYEFIKRYYRLRGEELSFSAAYKIFNGQEYQWDEKPTMKEEFVTTKAEFQNPLEIRLPEYGEGILDVFRAANSIHPWALEGVDEEALKRFEIGFSASYNGVTIPHRDFRGNLVGLRLRTFDEEKVKMSKYMPMLVNNIYYRHPTSLNFFGIFQNQLNIRKTKTVILVEGEKSVLQAESMWGRDSNITLAVCGGVISSWQTNMLIYYLGVEEVIIAFDKEYKNFSDTYDYIQRLREQVKTLKNFASVSVLIDEKDNFALKDSPFDRSIWHYNQLKNISL